MGLWVEEFCAQKDGAEWNSITERNEVKGWAKTTAVA